MTLNEGFAYEDNLQRHKGKHRKLCQELLNGRNLSLLEFYSENYQHSDELSWRKRILKGFITLNGLICQDPDRGLAVGDQLVYSRPPWIETAVPALTEALVLYEDADCLVFNKPEGLPVLPSSKFLLNTMHALARRLRPLPLSPVHRLGRGTTGAILFAKNPPAYRRLCCSLAAGEFGKEYLCLAQGTALPPRFTVDAPIGPVTYQALGQHATVHAASPGGRPAVSHFRVLRVLPSLAASLLLVRIETGRPHQIRIHRSRPALTHSAYAGWPLLGDPLYVPGGQPASPAAGQPAPTPGDLGYTLHRCPPT